MARGNDLGIEDYIQFAAAFLVGMMGVPALNALHSLQVRDIIRCVVSTYSSAWMSINQLTLIATYVLPSLVCQP